MNVQCFNILWYAMNLDSAHDILMTHLKDINDLSKWLAIHSLSRRPFIVTLILILIIIIIIIVIIIIII